MKKLIFYFVVLFGFALTNKTCLSQSLEKNFYSEKTESSFVGDEFYFNYKVFSKTKQLHYHDFKVYFKLKYPDKTTKTYQLDYLKSKQKNITKYSCRLVLKQRGYYYYNFFVKYGNEVFHEKGENKFCVYWTIGGFFVHLFLLLQYN